MNKFEEEIARLNQERDEKVAQFGQQIKVHEDNIHQENEAIKRLVQLRREAIQERNSKVHEVMLQQEDYYLKHGSNVKLRRILHGFFEKHPEAWGLWKAYKAEEEGGSHE